MSAVDDFINAITQQETGGERDPYASKWGKYAINPVYVPSLAQKYLGYSMTAQQYRSSPAAQDALGRAALTALYNQYGPERAASSWYSGNPSLYQSTKSQPGGPSIAGYVQSVMSRMGNSAGALKANSYTADGVFNPWGTDPTQATAQGPSLTSTDSSPLGAAVGLGLDASSGQSPAGMGLEAATGGNTYASPPAATPAADDGTGDSGTYNFGSSGATGLRGAAIQMASKALGVMYQWGGNSLSAGVDCSGLVQQALRSVGISVPRLSYDQLKLGPRIAINQLQPGDLVGWGNGHHVAMYIGNGQIIEAPRTGVAVRVRNLGDSYDRSEGIFGVSLAAYYR